MTIRILLTLSLGVTLFAAAAGAAHARVTNGSTHAHTQAIKTTQTQDETWAVIEYPEGREVVVNLAPTAFIPTARGTARVLRRGGETTIEMDATGLSGEASSYQVYAVDSLGNATVLGALAVTDGAGSLSITTPLNRLMIVLSPDVDLTGIAPETAVALMSTVPSGFTAVPREGVSAAETVVGAGVALRPETSPTEASNSDYDAPLLGVNSLRRGADTEMRAMYAGGSEGARAEVTLKPRKNGSTEVRLRFQGLRQAEEGRRYILWAVAPDNTYALLGQLIPTGKLGETGLKAETNLRDFGLFVTAEAADVAPQAPAGDVVVTVVR